MAEKKGKIKKIRNKIRRKEIEKRRGEEKEEKPKKERTIEVKRVAEKWETWNEKENAKRLVPEHFHQ